MISLALLGSLAWGKPCFPHEPPSSKSRFDLRAAQIGAEIEDLAERDEQ
jgi:hypothetical protein